MHLDPRLLPGISRLTHTVHSIRPGFPFTDVDSATSYDDPHDGQTRSDIFI